MSPIDHTSIATSPTSPTSPRTTPSRPATMAAPPTASASANTSFQSATVATPLGSAAPANTRTRPAPASPAPAGGTTITKSGGVRRVLHAVTATDGSPAQTALRLGLALVMFPHGAQKLFGWFGGFGFEGTMSYMTGAIGAPWVLAFLAIVAESLGPIALALGLFGRVAAFGIANVMIAAVATTHLTHGFFMDWNGTMAGEGFEYHLLVLAITVALILRGSGAGSLDQRIASRLANSGTIARA